MPLRTGLSEYWRRLQGELLPALAEELGPLSERHQHSVTVLDVVRPEAFIGHAPGAVGRPKKDRAAGAAEFSGQGGVQHFRDRGTGRSLAAG